VRAIPWPSGQWRARRRTDTGHAGRLHSRERAWGRVQPRFRGGGGVGREKGAAAATAARRRRRRATPTGGTVTPPRSAPAQGERGGRHGARAGGWDRPPRDGAPLTAPLARWLQISPTSRRNKSRAQARSPAGHRGRVEPRKSLRAVAARNSGRWGGAGGQAPSGPCDPCGRTVLLSHVTLFAFSVIATLQTLTRPQIPEDTNATCHL